jgi:hypothetical protein
VGPELYTFLLGFAAGFAGCLILALFVALRIAWKMKGEVMKDIWPWLGPIGLAWWIFHGMPDNED